MSGASGVKGFLNLIISLQLIFLPVAVLAQDNPQNHYTLNTSQLLNVDLPQLLKEELPFSPEEQAAIEKYFNMPARALLDMFLLEKVLAEKIKELQQTLSPEDIAKQIRSRDQDKEIKVVIPNIGKVEFTALGVDKDSPIVTKFVLYRLNKAIVSFDTTANPIDEITAQERSYMSDREYYAEQRRRTSRKAILQQYIAKIRMMSKRPPIVDAEINPFPDLSEMDPSDQRQLAEEFIQSAKDNKIEKTYYGKNEAEGAGIDTIVLVHDGKKISSREEYVSYQKLSTLGKIKNYWMSIYQTPRLNWEYWDNESGLKRLNTFRTGDSYVAQFSMIGQGYIYAAAQIAQNGSEVLKSFTHEGITQGVITTLHSVDPVGLALVAIWAVALGITPTYRNLTMLNQDRQIFLFKSFVNSTLFNYIFSVGLHGFNAVFSFSKEALNNNFVNLTNGIVTNFGKTWWIAKPRADENNGKNIYPINYGTLNTQVDKSFIDQQKWYLYSNVFKMADLIFKSSLFSILAFDFTYSRAALLFSIPVVHYYVMKYAESRDYKERYKLRQDWNEANYLLRLTAYRQKYFGVRKDTQGNKIEEELKGNDKLLTLNGHKIPVFYLGVLPGLIHDTWIVLKLSGVGAFYISKFSFDLMKSAVRFTTTRLFSYDINEKNAFYNEPITCQGLFSK